MKTYSPRCYTLGYYREDDVFQVVATLNNQQVCFSNIELVGIIDGLLAAIGTATKHTAYCYAREDAPDTLLVDPDEAFGQVVATCPAPR